VQCTWAEVVVELICTGGSTCNRVHGVFGLSFALALREAAGFLDRCAQRKQLTVVVYVWCDVVWVTVRE